METFFNAVLDVATSVDLTALMIAVAHWDHLLPGEGDA